MKKKQQQAEADQFKNCRRTCGRNEINVFILAHTYCLVLMLIEIYQLVINCKFKNVKKKKFQMHWLVGWFEMEAI